MRIGDEEVTRFDTDFVTGIGTIEGTIELSPSRDWYVSGWHDTPGGENQQVYTKVDADGYFALEGLAIGEWELALSGQGPIQQATRLRDHEWISVSQDPPDEQKIKIYTRLTDMPRFQVTSSTFRLSVEPGKATRFHLSREDMWGIGWVAQSAVDMWED